MWSAGGSGHHERGQSQSSLDKLMADAASRRFDGVLVWKLDRFGRLLVWLERRSSVRYAFGFLE